MTDLPHAPPKRDDSPSIARSAVEGVATGLPARRWQVRLLAALILPACAAAPFVGAGMVVAVAAGLAVLVRLAALVHLLGGVRPPDAPMPASLPRITILLPLHREVPVVEGLVASVCRIDYPPERVDVIALLEEDDPETLAALRIHAPPSWRIVVLPEGRPKTKARACNLGLELARGEVAVIFDGEDRPEPDQARKAVAALYAHPRRAVVQARLGCDHAGPGSCWLARLWALEYAVLFGAIQPALARAGLPFLLGGTSNWFRVAALRDVGGWDAHNVTEDADLGVRLARAGWTSSVIDSTTWEEAPIRLRQWLGQRSRWLKGFAVTTAVHFLRPDRLVRDVGVIGTLAIIAQLPATLFCAAAHPVGLWLIVDRGLADPLTLLAVAGYTITVGLHLAVARREGMAALLAPMMLVYWLLLPVAVTVAAFDLVRAPAAWRKTAHGLADRPCAADARSTLIRTLPWTRRPAQRGEPAQKGRQPALRAGTPVPGVEVPSGQIEAASTATRSPRSDDVRIASISR